MNKLIVFLKLIDIGHTLFALPFAYMGAFLAAAGWPSGHELIWITVAMVSARTSALGLNRIIDRQIDARNTRTAHWPLASGQISVAAIGAAVGIGLVLLFYAASQLNPLCLKLSPIAVLALALYSFTKRFTWTCHFFLGFTIAVGPLGAWLAVTPQLTASIVLLYVGVGVWVAGFDTVYACQDIDFDRTEHLYSIPSRFGIGGALQIAKWLHAITVIMLLGVGLFEGLGWAYYVGVVLVAGLLGRAHYLVRGNDLSHVNLAAFGLNRYVGMIMFLATVLSLWMR